MKQVVFVDSTKIQRNKYEKWVWGFVAVAAILAFGVFVFRPDLLLIP